MKLEPLGHTVLIKPDSLDKVTEGGIVIPDTVRERDRVGTHVGKIVAIAPFAWDGFHDNSHWAEVGDKIVYAKYGGKIIEDPDEGDKYVLVNDEDILCKVGD